MENPNGCRGVTRQPASEETEENIAELRTLHVLSESATVAGDKSSGRADARVLADLSCPGPETITRTGGSTQAAARSDEREVQCEGYAQFGAPL